MKEIDPDRTIYDLTVTYPELIPILKEMGFFGVANPVVRNTLGRATTLSQGCEKQGKDFAEVVGKLRDQGFEVRSSSAPEAAPSN